MADRPEAILLQGDASAVLAQLPEGCAQTCVTSPPYYGLRDYGVAGQLGGEATPQAYVASLVAVMRAVRRVLAGDGTLWLNLGDSYGPDKQLLGVPWRVALALQADGWVLRADVVWHKPNAMPETTRDRPSRGHEYLFLLAAQGRYHYDAAAIREPAAWERWGAQRSTKREGKAGIYADRRQGGDRGPLPKTKNKRTVWTIPTQSYKGAHFATFPEALGRSRACWPGAGRTTWCWTPSAGAGRWGWWRGAWAGTRSWSTSTRTTWPSRGGAWGRPDRSVAAPVFRGGRTPPGNPCGGSYYLIVSMHGRGVPSAAQRKGQRRWARRW